MGPKSEEKIDDTTEGGSHEIKRTSDIDNETGGGFDNTDTTKGDYDDTTINNMDDDTTGGVNHKIEGDSDIDNGTGGENGNVDTTKGNNDENTTEGVKKSIEEGSDMALMNDLFSTTEEGGNGIE